MKIRHFCPFSAILGVSIAVHISAKNKQLLVFNSFLTSLFYYYFVFINYLISRSNNFVILFFIYGEIKLTYLLTYQFS